MSQITRCPSCATTFKVVADQLRISEGWVRCGQCKEVFDASAHLLPMAPAPLLPDVSLTDLRAPTAPIARKPDALESGGGKSPTVPAPAPQDVDKAGTPAIRSASTSVTEVAATAAMDAFPYGMDSDVPAAPVLNIPSPAVPAFLTAGARTEVSSDVLGKEVAAPFAWRAHSASRTATAVEAAASPSVTAPADAPEPVVIPDTALRLDDHSLPFMWPGKSIPPSRCHPTRRRTSLMDVAVCLVELCHRFLRPPAWQAMNCRLPNFAIPR